MKLTTKIYIGLAIVAVLATGIIVGTTWSNHTIATLEHAVNQSKKDADTSEKSAIAKEIEAAEYKQKIDYLERQLTEIQSIARKQDEELKNLNNNSRNARGDLDRARRTRSIEATATELCVRLAELGHGCE
jgi:peptidoglycan hydrolase CwlO-like protein